MRVYRTLWVALFLSVTIAGCGADNGSGIATTTPPTTTAVTTTSPTVSSTSPDDGEMGVLTNLKVVARFSEAMDPSTITDTSFTVMQGTTLVIGTVTYSAVDRAATFTPTTDILPNTIYTATITNDAAIATITIEPTDMGSNGQTVNLTTSTSKAVYTLAADKIWTFTTGDL